MRMHKSIAPQWDRFTSVPPNLACEKYKELLEAGAFFCKLRASESLNRGLGGNRCNSYVNYLAGNSLRIQQVLFRALRWRAFCVGEIGVVHNTRDFTNN